MSEAPSGANAELLITAAARFEAARRIVSASPGHPTGRLHGHGFVATARVPARADADGDAVETLGRRLAAAVAPLHYAEVNAVVADPTDAALARWIAGRPELPQAPSVGVASTPAHGVWIDATNAAHRWQRFRFEAAHRLLNVPPGHKCGRMHGHGFEVVLVERLSREAAAGAPIDTDRLQAAWSAVHPLLDHACLNDISGLENPTSELLAAWLWHRLATALPALARVTVFETETCGAHFDGRMHRIWKEATLDSAVRLERAPAGDPRRRLHGHTYRLRLHLEGPLDAALGWAIDFGDVKQRFQPVFERLDHQPLHLLQGVEHADCAALARWIRGASQPLLPELCGIDLEQTPGHGVMLRWRDGRL